MSLTRSSANSSQDSSGYVYLICLHTCFTLYVVSLVGWVGMQLRNGYNSPPGFNGSSCHSSSPTGGHNIHGLRLIVDVHALILFGLLTQNCWYRTMWVWSDHIHPLFQVQSDSMGNRGYAATGGRGRNGRTYLCVFDPSFVWVNRMLQPSRAYYLQDNLGWICCNTGWRSPWSTR